MTRSRMLQSIVAALLAAGIVAVLSATGRSAPTDGLIAAERLYAEGVSLSATDEAGSTARFTESARILGEEIASQDTAGIRFNRANALLRSGQLAAAIAEYRAADLRAPGDPSVGANLAEARRKVANAPAPPDERPLERARTLWSALTERTRLAFTAVLLIGGFLAWRLRAVSVGGALLALALLTGCTVAIDLTERARPTLAVLSEPSALRKGNGDGFDAALAEPLPIGTECRILESRPGWLEIELGGALRGWVKDTALVRVE